MRRLGVITTITLAVVGLACAGVKKPGAEGTGGGGGNVFAGAAGSTGNPFGQAGTSPPPADGGSNTRTDGAVTYPLRGTITSDVPSPVTVSGKPMPIHLAVKMTDGSMPGTIIWSVDNIAIGSVGSDGVFTPNGYVGGVATVTATVGGATGTTKITVDVDITDNPNTLNPQNLATLQAGGKADAQFKWLYPYDKTVFPRGLTAPVLQFGGTGSRATYMTVTAPHFRYQQYTNLNDPLQVKIPQPIWKGLGLTVGPKDPVNVSINKLAGDVATGPLTQSWFIAPATINGVFYYNTYAGSMLAGGGGGIMRIPAGQDAQLVVKGCTVCHSVSANGNVMAAGSENAAKPGSKTAENPNGDWNPTSSQTYNLTTAGAATVRTQTTDGQTFSFIGLTPDGSKGLVSGLPPKRNWPFLPHGIFSTPGTPSRLVDTQTGLDIATPSLAPLVQYATTPAFSPDGAHVAFVNSDKLGPTCLDKTCTGTCLAACQRVLSVMDFDGAANTFSNVRDLVTGAGPGAAVAWPSFLPDGQGILFHKGDSIDSDQFVSDSAPLTPQYADLMLVETKDKSVKTLNALNGRDAAGNLYLPFGETVEGHMNYEPSVLPVAVGGYYWVLFTSRRVYGNTIAPTSGDPAGNDAFGSQANPSVRKKIWIAAIDINHAGKEDPSHPAFYLPGQELRTANMRAFAALAPCKANNMSCETGDDCCGGFCRETSRGADGTPVLECVLPPANTCSNDSEACKASTDCCNPASMCINGRCAYIIP